jgi:hypothetical protein
MNGRLIQITPEEVVIPLSYFPNARELELVVTEDAAVVRAKAVSPRLHQNKRQVEMLEQTAAFETQYPQLLQNYSQEYVAIYQGKLVDHDSDHIQLVRRIQQHFPGQIVLIRQVTEQPATSLNLGSPRFVR